ncbi:hypothetical protein [Myxococcus sp. SDU36]|uniref:hypothetical protein n=1 Tax=Myxococcus sp. SDU36 TaxID=2831967 RepID=UPI0025435107|nr:hypothetical protein [Myxococcus sp. SDU36]WIG96947.1 hypothetical protein KGD87_05920 [Myxococcus sp. SDU36]
MARLLTCSLLLLSLTGCFRMSLRSGAPRGGAPEQQTGVSLVAGLTTSNVVTPECQHGFSRVDVYWPWWGPVVFAATFGVVAPLRTEYVCAEAAGVAPPDHVPPSHSPL